MNLEKKSNERLNRIRELRCLGGRLGLVSPSLVQWLLGICRQRVWLLISQGRLKSVGLNGFRLVLMSSVLEFSKDGQGRKRKSRVPGRVVKCQTSR
jgi:hypothetical protein